MDIVLNIIRDSDKKYTHKISECKYIQSQVEIDDSYTTINELFLSLYDPNFSLLPSKEKSLYVKQKYLQIATDIDEKSREVYERFNYNNKFKKVLIQRGLQLSNHLSTVLYLNDLYCINSILVFKSESKYYQTSKKDKEFVYLIYDETNQKWSLGSENDILNCNKEELSSLNSVIINDINNDNIYQNHLKSLSNYKVGELKELASKLNISDMINGKKKTKKNLYDDINFFHLNLI